MRTLDAGWNGDLVALVRFAKMWKHNCSVPVKSFLLEQLGIEFLSQWATSGKGPFWFDFMLRDFFGFILRRQNAFGTLPVSNEMFFYGDVWATRAETACKNASRACFYEQHNLNAQAGEEWQKVFGTYIPKEV